MRTVVKWLACLTFFILVGSIILLASTLVLAYTYDAFVP